MPTENYLLLGQKRRLIESLRQKGITDENVLNAFDKMERHRFLESVLWPRAYDDEALKLTTDQTISKPSTVAFQSQLLEVKRGMKVLEIGTGSGFQAAILYAMGAKVFTVERQIALFKRTKPLLDKLAPSVVTYYGDGFKGYPQFAPYDRVIVTCGAPNVPQALLDQLVTGGIMVIPVGVESQTMKKIVKISETEYEEEDFGNFLFVPMLKERVRR
ncbi:MAG: protein-L-isoaspartate(D-aspartate) O-methyltransferase [Bacteroidales bacterium]|nr:protein-L-isoaspartate(D-aspartate) O-methyltransferase [Bacteroidales bacterium]